MKCPNCKTPTKVALNLHSDGFTAPENPLKECGSCGHVWRNVPTGTGRRRIDVVRQGK